MPSISEVPTESSWQEDNNRPQEKLVTPGTAEYRFIIGIVQSAKKLSD